ncbi:uncharacterized protein LOC9645524 isoform X2 [Selaginella moellendorffii]|uniref:uncharacterized protein LOC9645524 isoform X2 n=1 Tax=Selaginella moellendorffii TaxID=88036 RepID=UPI000D1C7735|nr:uncharacterized protein LOC9645524 isoform X2 [Selaginella moellendorffii]|eukprot:XP_024530561.1 uncharacterized protein LOC9645524 isoform X2 [Selaginella moellendorffii]
MRLRASYRSVVVGAGPAGLAAIANLLDAGIHPILWVDPAFAAGRLARYQRVPSNTKVQLFVDFAMASPTLARLAATMSPPPLGEFESMDPQGTCLLKHTARMVSQLTRGIQQHLADKVDCYQGWVTRVHGSSKPSWSVALGVEAQDQEATVVDTDSVIFATGSHPIPSHSSWAPHKLYARPEHAKMVEELSLETALDPGALQSGVTPSDVVAVVGGSHSGVLCLKNLAELPNRPRKILHYYRQELKYAVYMDGWILYDNTGLKGDAAVWAQQVLEPGLVPRLDSHHLESPESEAEIYKATMPEVTKIIYAIGFQRNKLPEMVLEEFHGGGSKDHGERVKHSPQSGKLVLGDKPIPGLWGYGIAFPEETVDPLGNKEWAVGLWKFMRYMKKVIPENVAPEIMSNSSKL